ncbi:MAG: sigma-54-dependent Fis family transcriptional regulator [Verrucomicrobia bacterium]|nr:MAG: sigma-54-dependent Fis family transcriptional regulator [Verrucomicrobiota bacterium]TAE86512.1 MAG: sigma-54-dependent Fis family transcriptional regulator [Verrucomicrobiota bacterium]TAF24148.1 MAG: sigma-54-dependent Fis family transcriptional regulator [Verrucomicrobiota bacterium]
MVRASSAAEILTLSRLRTQPQKIGFCFQHDQPQSNMKHGNHKPRILIVEPDPTTADQISQAALKFGFLPSNCPSLRSAETADWHDLSALLLDLQQPDGDGFDLLSWARSRYPHLPCFVLTAMDSAEWAISSIKAGAADYLIKPFDAPKVFSSIRGALTGTPPAHAPRKTVPGNWKSEAMQSLHESALKTALLRVPVLLLGEAGTGRRSLASFIHAHSQRSAQPFASIDARAFGEEELELELFGGESRQAGGKLVRKRGKIEMADGGTLFIEEIDRLPPKIQSQLLDTLETRSEAGQTGRFDFRLISSAGNPIRNKVVDGSFREDLFYRISTSTLQVPALRDLAADIETWCDLLLTEICIANGCRHPQITRGARESLADHSWPGNLDELRHVLENALALSNGAIIGSEQLRGTLRPQAKRPDVVPGQLLGLSTIDDMERASLVAALEACNGNRRRAAQRLGVSQRTIYNMIDRYELRAQNGEHKLP